MSIRRNRTPVRPKARRNELYMKRQAEERNGKSDAQGVEEREQKRQKEVKPMESENTGGASSSRDHTQPEQLGDQPAESATNKSVPDVTGPSRKEREEHEVTHCSYRNWCEHCVKGRGREDGHHRKTSVHERPEIPTIAMDYCFMGKEDKKPLTILVIKDNDSKAMKAFSTSQKGSSDGDIVKKIQRLIDDQWGRRTIIFKADKEAAIRELRDRVRDVRTDETVVEHSAKGDSQSNSIAERAVQDFEGLMRTWLSALQDKYRANIPADHPIIAFLVEYIGEMYNNTHIGPDGKTPYKRIKGRESTKQLIPFGEKVLYKREKPTSKKNKLEEKFKEGIWAGVLGTSKEHIILTESGPKIARTIRRMEDDEKYDLDLLNKVVGKPIADLEHDAQEDSEVDKDASVECQVKESESEERFQEEMYETKRRWKITKEDIDKHGIAPGCLGCRTIKAGLPRQNHNENCRKRIEEEIMKTQEGRARVDRSNARITEQIAMQIEQEDTEMKTEKTMSSKGDSQRDTARDVEEPTIKARSRGESSTTTDNTQTKDDELPIHPKDRSTDVKLKEKRRNEDEEEDKQGEKRRRLGRLSKGKQWLHWKKEMEDAFSEEPKMQGASSKQLQGGPIMTVYVQDDHEEYFIDDVYGKILDPDKARKARLEELRYFKKMGVYEKCDIRECWINTGKNPIKVRWIDTNKTNDPIQEVYRSRLVAKEYKTSNRPELYSGTPPVDLLRMVISKVADAQSDQFRWCKTY